MSENYKGMRWLKCDFQVQTPEDNAHWADDDLRLGETRKQKKKRVALQRRYSKKSKNVLKALS